MPRSRNKDGTVANSNINAAGKKGVGLGSPVSAGGS